MHPLAALLETGSVLNLSGQLAAGGVDVITPSAPHCGHDAGIDQDLSETPDAGIGRSAQPGIREGIEGNQIELAGHITHQVEQLVGICVGIVDTIEHHVLEGDEIARRTLEVATAGGHQLRKRILAVERHQRVTQRIVGRMQRHRQRHRTILAQPVHHGDNPRGGHGDAAPRQTVGVVVEQDAQGGERDRIVLQRLTHAHEHDIADDALAIGRRTQGTVGPPQLPYHLGHVEIAAEALLAGGAEQAIDRTPGLRGDAQRAAIGFRNEHRFHGIALPDVEQPLARAIGGDVIGDDRRRPNFGTLDQRSPEGLRKIGHLIEAVLAPLVDPAHELAGPKRLFAPLGAGARQALGIEAEEIDQSG